MATKKKELLEQENTAPAAAPRRALFLLLPHRNNIPVNLINM